MVDVLLSIAPAAVAGLALSSLLEVLLNPRPLPIWRRPLAAFLIHCGLWLLLFAGELLLFRRPWFAMANVQALLLLVVLVNNAKFASLREPFIFQDFDYFIDALRHPRLYLPFLGIWRTLAAIAGFGAALFGGLTLETPLTAAFPITLFLAGVLVVLALGITLVVPGQRNGLNVSLDPLTDLRRFGLLASLWHYGWAERSTPVTLPAASHVPLPSENRAGERPNLVMVQSESFFDPRRSYPGIRPDLLRCFDKLKADAICHGLLEVPAWGANTVRTEFEVLSGLNSASLGIHRFNPYRRLARQPLTTIASTLKSQGYRTICIHPYPARFYDRDQVFPLLGFDEFIDINAFAGTEKTGPYIGDIACAKKVCALLEASGRQSEQPLFLFVITMENHGPLHLEKVLPEDLPQLYSSPPPPGCDDLAIFLRHIANADRMIGMLRQCLEASDMEGWLCFFGDHVPIMATVYEKLGDPDGKTDYAIWKSGNTKGVPVSKDIKAEQLGALLLTEMGVVGR